MNYVLIYTRLYRDISQSKLLPPRYDIVIKNERRITRCECLIAKMHRKNESSYCSSRFSNIKLFLHSHYNLHNLFRKKINNNMFGQILSEHEILSCRNCYLWKDFLKRRNKYSMNTALDNNSPVPVEPNLQGFVLRKDIRIRLSYSYLICRAS